MIKSKLKHAEIAYTHKKNPDPKMNQFTLKSQIRDAIGEGLFLYDFSQLDLPFGMNEVIEQMINIDKVKDAVIKAITPEVLNAVTPYYKDEFFSMISEDELSVSPWWDDYWQTIKIVDMFRSTAKTDHNNIESLEITRDALLESVKIMEKAIQKSKESK